MFACSLGLAACETTLSVSDINPFGSDEPQACPRAAPLADAARLVEFGRGRTNDDGNLRHRAEITGSLFDCEITGTRVTGRLGIVGEVTLGRRGKTGDLTLPVFVALTRSGTDVVSKRFDTVEVTIPRGATSAQFEKVIPDYTFELGSGRTTTDYELLSGFNLTPEQVEYNRRLIGG